MRYPREGAYWSVRPLSLEVKLGAGEDWASRQAEGCSGSFHGPWEGPKAGTRSEQKEGSRWVGQDWPCLLYTSDAADDRYKV